MSGTDVAEQRRRRWPLVDRAELVRSVVDDVMSSGALISGYAGVGKTALARLVERTLERDGVDVRWLTATLTGRNVPYSALAGLAGLADSGVGGAGLPSPADLATAIRAAVSEDRNRVLVLDDAQWLDAHSLGLVIDVVRHGGARLLVTVRAGEPGDAEWQALADDGALTRVTLGIADRSLVSSVAERSLGGPVTTRLSDELFARSGGNLLFLRELLIAGLDSAAIALAHRRWDLLGPLPSEGSLASAIGRRLRSLDRQASHALVAVSIVEPISFELISRLPIADHLVELEHRGLVDTDSAGMVRIAHPLLGEAARTSLSTLEYRATLDEITDDVLSKLPDHLGDLALRLVRRRIEHELFVPVGWLRDTARRAFALLDHALAVDLGERAIELDPHDVEARLVVGAALSAQFATAEADPHLRAALEHARTDSQRARAGGRLGLHLGTRLGRRDEAVEVMRATLADISDPHWAAFLAADIGKIELLSGTGGSATPSPSIDDPLATLNQAIMSALVGSLGGDVDGTRACVRTGTALADQYTTTLPNGRDLLRLSEFIVTLVSDGPRSAQALADDELLRCAAGRDEPEGMWRVMLATAALAAGRPGDANAHAERALPLVAVRDFVGGLHPGTQALRAVALAQLDRLDEAEQQLAEIDHVWRSDQRTHAAIV
ncbi:MAG: AAA family ATPase, partial [Ilumatobacteraceae bacterium]